MQASNRAFRPAVNIPREAPLKSQAGALRQFSGLQATTPEVRDKIFFRKSDDRTNENKNRHSLSIG
jgi:hypothetical protein